MAGLHVDDINLIRQVIEIASTRGAFQAGELKSVGEVYEKVTTFLNEVQENQEQSKKEGTPQKEESTEEVEVTEETKPD
tara:strand:+ start:588 stop:824 length:237 start_codon:yes stop_codon:yes gene_type:complete